jgi:hypothetical protein
MLILGLTHGSRICAGDDQSASGLDRVVDVLLDSKDLAPAPRIAALLTESALTLDPKVSGAEYSRTKLPRIFAQQLRQARERQADSPFRDPNFRPFGIAPNQDSFAHIEQQVAKEFGGLMTFPQRRLEEAFGRVPAAEVESGELFAFYDSRMRDSPTFLLLVIFNPDGRIVLIDEL